MDRHGKARLVLGVMAAAAATGAFSSPAVAKEELSPCVLDVGILCSKTYPCVQWETPDPQDPSTAYCVKWDTIAFYSYRDPS